MRRCAVSIDVDPIPCYYRIHGLGPAPAELRDAVMHRCVPRFADVLERRGIRATFFIVGQDVDRAAVGEPAHETRNLLRALVRAGHEIGNHSYSHPYDLARRDAGDVEYEIRRAHELLCESTQENVVGFRAPGYDLSPAMIACLSRLGYAYDSSMFPAPGYYAAKAVVMAALVVRGANSGAVLTNPRALRAPANPYRPDLDAPWRRGSAPLIELPIAVTPIARTPVIGTSLLLAPRVLREHWLRAMRRRPFFNLELHGIDLADAEQDRIPAELVARQPDLRVPLLRKLAAFEATLDYIARDFQFTTLQQFATSASVVRGQRPR